MRKEPDILLITVDQMRFDHLGLKGVKGIDTPNLNRLGSEGIHFDRAYTPSPVCTPARMTLLTGQYPSSHGAYSIGVSVDPFPEQTLPKILKDNGVPECHYRAWLDQQGVDYSQWFPDLKDGHDHAQTGVWDIPVEYHDSTWITNNTIDYLEDRSRSTTSHIGYGCHARF